MRRTLPFLLTLATAALVLSVASTGAVLAGDADAPHAFSFLGPGGGAFLGVALEEATDHAEGGARIRRVIEDSAAEAAGLAAGDVVIAVDGHTIRGPVALAERIRDLEPGDEVEIVVVRDGRERAFDVELGSARRPDLSFFGDEGMKLAMPLIGWAECDDDEQPCSHSFSWNCSGNECEKFNLFVGAAANRPLLGVQLASVTSELREHLGGDAERGVLVSRVVPDSAAEAAGIEVGDLIVGVDGEGIADAGDVRHALVDRFGETIDVDVIRERRPLSIAVTLDERDESTGDRGSLHFAPRIELDLEGLDERIEEIMERVREGVGLHDATRDHVMQLLEDARSDGGAGNDASTALRQALERAQTERGAAARALERVRRSRLQRQSI